MGPSEHFSLMLESTKSNNKNDITCNVLFFSNLTYVFSFNYNFQYDASN